MNQISCMNRFTFIRVPSRWLYINKTGKTDRAKEEFK